MKKTAMLITSLLAICTAKAFALPADHFQCRLSISDHESHTESTQNVDLWVPRYPVVKDGFPNVQFTAGKSKFLLEMTGKEVTLESTVNFFYQHAIKFDEGGKPVDVRQSTCMAMSFQQCSETGAGGLKPCELSLATCSVGPNPFSEAAGWSKTLMMSGIPAFNQPTVTAKSSALLPNGSLKATTELRCDYRGTAL